MADTRQELEGAVFDLAARVESVRAALTAVITDDVDAADRLDVLEGAYRVLGDAMDSMWTAWERFDQGACSREKGATPKEPPLTLPPVCSYTLTCQLLSKLSGRRLAGRVIGSLVAVE